ncbi:roquin-1 isoform X1 [Lingula anatina]|uniref:RING-type E3 ubiquitin transferase n=1 Tax=Lingula anatina TaxID=7574 RepID=A0A1S3K605_LINAN|nr:roquin-1 isoform X1 [Lingula anatina]|eukprot:XP_013418060.1 roquin-1 isoform X1 [Lingula anatina]
MPVQAPQWTEFLTCPVCFNDFNGRNNIPVSLGCGHTICRTCLKQLHQNKCPFEQSLVSQPADRLPSNTALLKLLGVKLDENEDGVLSRLGPNVSHFKTSRKCIEDMAGYLHHVTGTQSNKAGNNTSLPAPLGTLSRPMQRKLVILVNCQLVEEEGRARALRAARSLGDRTVTELILLHQNPQQLSANLWAAVRARGCQFLGPAMQEEVLKLILLALENGSALSRKVLVLFVVQRLETQFPQASKTAIGHVVQLLYRASCFKVTKRDDESSLMQLKEEFRTYDALRREHDSQIVQIATEAGLRIAPEQWSSLLYGDAGHKSHMQSIIDKLQTPQSFAQSVNELVIALQRTGDPANLAKLRPQLDLMTSIDPSPDAPPPSWENLEAVLKAVKTVVDGLVEFTRNHSHKKYEAGTVHNLKYKTSMCRDLVQMGSCPRGATCTFAHSEEEMERHRNRNKRWTGKVSSSSSLTPRDQADLAMVTKESRFKLATRENTAASKTSQQPEEKQTHPQSNHQISRAVPVPTSKMSLSPVSQASPPVVLPSSMPMSQVVKPMSYTMPHPHDLVHKSIGRPRMSSYEVPTVEGLALHSPTPPSEPPTCPPVPTAQRPHYEPWVTYPPYHPQAIPRTPGGTVRYAPGVSPYPQQPPQQMPAYPQVQPGVVRYNAQRVPPPPEYVSTPQGLPAYPGVQQGMMAGYPPGAEYAVETHYQLVQQPIYGYDQGLGREYPKYLTAPPSTQGGAHPQEQVLDPQTAQEENASIEQLERRRSELLNQLRNKQSRPNTSAPSSVGERKMKTTTSSYQQQQSVVDALISSSTTTAYNDTIWSSKEHFNEDMPWSTGEATYSDSRNGSTIDSEAAIQERHKERAGAFLDAYSETNAPLSSLSYEAADDFDTDHHGDHDDDGDDDEWVSKDISDFQHLISRNLFTTIYSSLDGGKDTTVWTYNSLSSTLPEEIIPFSDKPIVSRFGPISRVQRNETNLQVAKPVQVTASQGGNPLPSTAVTPVERPFPNSYAVPSRYPPNPFGLAEVEQAKTNTSASGTVMKNSERLQRSSRGVAANEAEREQLKLELQKIDAQIIQAAESARDT